MKSNIKLTAKPISFFFLFAFLFFNKVSSCQRPDTIGETVEIGVAKVDITPEGPIRLAGSFIKIIQDNMNKLGLTPS